MSTAGSLGSSAYKLKSHAWRSRVTRISSSLCFSFRIYLRSRRAPGHSCSGRGPILPVYKVATTTVPNFPSIDTSGGGARANSSLYRICIYIRTLVLMYNDRNRGFSFRSHRLKRISDVFRYLRHCGDFCHVTSL